MKRYFATSFTVDFISYFPANVLGVYKIFGDERARATRIFIRMVFKQLQLHRFFSLMTYLQTNILSQRSVTIQMIKYKVLVFTALGISSVLLLNLTCNVSLTTGVSRLITDI